MRISCAVGVGAALFCTPLSSQSVYPTGTTIWDPGATEDGYTIFSSVDANGAVNVVNLIDMDGTVVHTWTNPDPARQLTHVEPLDSGKILALDREAGRGSPRRKIYELDWSGAERWSYEIPASEPQTTFFHHDVTRLANGNTLGLGGQDVLLPSISPDPFEDDLLVEIDPAGNIVWLWELYKFADQLNIPQEQLDIIEQSAGDWAHGNSAQEIPPNSHTDSRFAPGNIIISLRFLNTICIVERSTGNIVWQDGPGPDHLTWGAHYPHMIEQGLPGEGNLLVFSNGSGTGYCNKRRAPGRSSVLEIDPVTKSVVWEYSNGQSFWSNILSSAQRLSNGNTLICSGAKGRLFEVTPAGEIVWEYMSPFFSESNGEKRHRVYRAFRLPYSWKP